MGITITDLECAAKEAAFSYHTVDTKPSKHQNAHLKGYYMTQNFHMVEPIPRQLLLTYFAMCCLLGKHQFCIVKLFHELIHR